MASIRTGRPFKINVHMKSHYVKAAHEMTVSRVPVMGGGAFWKIRFEPAAPTWMGLPGVYQWRIIDADSGELTGLYIGMAKTFAGRVPVYWQEMTPQLVEIYFGNRARLARNPSRVRQDKSPLRWVHFWMARAYERGDRVQLVISTTDTEAQAEELETALIEAALDLKRPLLNHESYKPHRVSAIHRVLSRLRAPTDPLFMQAFTVPKDWGKWASAIDTWEGHWRKHRDALKRKSVTVLDDDT